MKAKSYFTAILTGACLMIVLGVPGTTSAAKVKKNIHKTFELQRGGNVSVKNTNGTIEIDSWDEEKIEIQAEIVVKHSSRRTAEDYLDEVEILFDHDDDYTDIEVDYPRRNEGGFLSWIFGHGRPEVSVRFQIKVPQRADLKIHTVNGSIKIEDVSGRIETRSTNGSMRLSDVNGDISCKTTNGGISVRLVAAKNFEEMTLSTVNGAIRVSVPSEINATVKASTVNGGISTDLPLAVKGKFNRKSIRGDLNDGGAYIVLKTVNGGISIRDFN